MRLKNGPHQLLSRPGAHYHRAPFVKLSHCLAAGGLLLVVSACTVTPSPTQPTALRTVAASARTGFEPAFYRAFVQNAFETPERLEPIRLLRGSLRVYVQTQDNGGRAIDDAT